MASPPPASSSSSLETFLLSEIGDLAADDIFLCARPKHRNRRLLQVAKKTSYTGSSSEQDIAKDGKQYSPRPGERSKHIHECILDPPRTSVFILDSTATSHVVGDMSLFSPSSFRSRTPTTPAGTAAAAAAATYEAHDGRVLTVAGAGTVSCDSFRIPSARCVPDLCTGLNLVSVQQLAECGYLVVFGGGQCSVMKQGSSKIVGKGRLHADDGLYHLEFLHLAHDKDCEDSTAT